MNKIERGKRPMTPKMMKLLQFIKIIIKNTNIVQLFQKWRKRWVIKVKTQLVLWC